MWAAMPELCAANDNSISPPDDAFANGRPVRTMKTLNEIEPRISIDELPFVITSSGSYFVTGSLTGRMARSGVTIDASDVDLDLNGFTLFGGAQTLDGVRVMANNMNVRVRNGVIRGWGRYGVNATNAFDIRLNNVRAVTNNLGGMRIGHDSLLTGCGAYYNVGDGIFVESGSTVAACRARGNAIGIHAAGACRISGCTSIANNDSGFMAGDYSTVRDCIAAWNSRNGIVLMAGCRAQDNTCGMNGRELGDGAGIHVQGDGNRIEDNNLTQNFRGIVAPILGNLIIRNSVRASIAEDYLVDDNNVHGEILRDVTGGATGFSNTNPRANFVLPGTAAGP